MPTIFKNISAPKGVLFSMGFLVHDYTKYIEKFESKKLINILEKTIGPVTIMISVDKGLKSNLDEISYSPEFLKNRLIDFINNGGE
jgi:hypothetical protein